MKPTKCIATLVLDTGSADSHLIHLDKQSTLIGKASEADVSFESDLLADHHALIEYKEDGYYLINLQGGANTVVNGESVSCQKLNNGDRLKIGDVNAVIMLEEEDSPEYDTPMPATLNLETLPAPGTTSAVARNHYRECPQCGFSVPENMLMCPQCGQTLSNNAIMQPGFIQPVPINLAGPGILPVIAFLAAVSVIGAPVALVLGLIALSLIRRHGGTVRDHRMAEWAIGLGLFWIMVGLLATGGLVQKAQERKQLDAQKAQERKQLDAQEVYEAKVIRALKNLACAQKYAHTIEHCDADLDGHGEYGDLSVLAKMNSPFFDSDLADGEAYGYRFVIREASEGRFLAVAEPIRYKDPGIRTFVIDQSGQIRGGDAAGKRFGKIGFPLPVLQGERSAYYEIDDEIAKDVLNYAKSLASSPDDQEKKQRILIRLRKEYSLTSVGRELEGMEATVDRFVTEHRAQAIYLEAQAALAEESQDVALAKLMEIQNEHPSFSKIAAVERELIDLRSEIDQQREVEAQDLFTQAEEGERKGLPKQEVQRLFQRIEKLYPDTEVAARIVLLRPELQRQSRERNAEEIFSELMELSPESEFEKILSQAHQLRRNYSDTDLFKKIETELTKKERSARANAWRFKTRQNIEAGRMRGALAQLDSAIRENPDLQYDLRDLCIQLYRDVADQMVEEGDARGALGYYTQLNRLLQQAARSEEQVNRELLAKLHNDVGMADFESEDYTQARWHLVSANWHYQDDAQFNLRLGVASLYSGLYRPAEEALTQALTVQPDMEPALLYRSYLNMKVALALEQVIAGGLQLSTLENEDAGSDPSDVTIGPDEGSSLPEPTDLDLALHYNYATNRTILPDLVRFAGGLRGAVKGFKEELDEAKPENRDRVKLSILLRIAELRNQLSDLRKTHLQDLAAQEKMVNMMDEMEQRVDAAISDIQTASDKQPRLQSLAKHILPQINTKRAHLSKSADLLTSNMEKENDVRKRIFKLAETMLGKAATFSLAGSGRSITSYVGSLFKQTEDHIEIDRALLLLRDAMEEEVDLKDILRAAEGRAE